MTDDAATPALDPVDLAARLIRLDTSNPPGRERPASDLIADLLRDAGLAVTRVPVDGVRETLIAVLGGSDATLPARIFTGHLDVVPVGDAEAARWTRHPFSGEVSGGRLHGRGSTDMLGGLAALVVAVASLGRAHRTPPADVLVVLTCDEEDLMSGSKAVADHPLLARDADLVVCEPTGLRLCTAGRGRTWARVTLRGGTGHGAQAGSANPIQLAARLIADLDAEDFAATASADSEPSFWRPLAIAAGVEPCVVPDACTLTIDARLAIDHAPDDVWRRLGVHLARLTDDAAGVSAEVTVVDAREGWRTPSASGLVGRVTKALDAEGRDPRPEVFAGTTDGTVLRRATLSHGVRDVVIVGPGELALAHREDESVAVDELDAATRLYRRLMLA